MKKFLKHPKIEYRTNNLGRGKLKTKGVFFMLIKDSFHLTNFPDAIKYWKM